MAVPKWLAQLLTAALCGLFLAEICVGPNIAIAATPAEMEAFALAEAQKRIPKKLKNPKSAEFDDESLESAPLVGWGDGKRIWRRVEGVVRGTNGFGGVVPNDWSAYVADSDGELTVAAVLLEGDFVYRGELSDVVSEEFDRMLREIQEERDRERRERQAVLDAQMQQNQEMQRVERIRRTGHDTGAQMANAMGPAKMRLSEKEAASRAKKYAKQAKLNEDDTKLFIEGFVAGVTSAKSNGSKR
jgi:hypothetical protein